MKRTLVCFTAVVLTFCLGGCGGRSEPGQSGSPVVDSSDHDHDSGSQADEGAVGQSDMEKMKAALAKLSAEDAAAAEKQHFCPVSGEMLGAMGPPIKVDVDGQQVWICCEGCRKPLLDDPAKYLAKLKQ